MADFKRVALWEIAKTQSGWTPSRANSKLWWWNIIRLKSWELNDNTNITEYSETITQAWIENSSAKLFPKWTLLIAMYGATAGKLGILWVDASTNQAICSIQNIKWLFDSKYLFYVLLHKRDQIVKDSFWWAQPNISKTYLDNFQIPLPPLEEQKKIVAYLDELNATISKLKSEYQSQLAMLDEMRNSSLDLAFWGSRERGRERERAYNLNNWKWVKLGDVCEILDSKRKPITQKDRIDWPYPYYWATWIVDYVNDYLFDEKLVLIWEDWAKWGSGDNTAFSVEGKIWVNNHAHVLRPFRKQLRDDFLIYYLLIKDLSEYITGTTVPKLNQEKLKNIEIPLPDLEMQSQIVAHLDQVHQQITMLKTQVNSQIEHCDELWQSSLEKVLTQGVNNEFN